MKSAPKRLRNLLKPLNRPLPICRDFYLPGVHLNDMAGLRAAIIASCTIRATQELRQGPLTLTFLVPVRRPCRKIDLLVILGGELRDAAFRLGAGPFALAGIDHEEILGVRLQVFQVDTVILGFGLLVV